MSIKQFSINFYTFILLIAFVFSFRLFGYLPFHIVVEFSSILIGFYIFIFAFRLRNVKNSGFFIIVGTFYLTVSLFDILHTFTYKGMGVFPVNELNVATQFWVVARLTEGSGYVLGALFSGKKLSFKFLLLLSLCIFFIFSWMILYTSYFPDALLVDTGLTDFKIYAEYTVIGLILLSLATLFRLNQNFDYKGYLFLVISLVVTALSEFSFTLYNDVYGVMNMTGHILKAISFFIMLYVFSFSHVRIGDD